MELPDVLCGVFVLITSGTGILAVLDFIFYIFRYMMHIISKRFYNNDYNTIDINEIEGFDNIQNNFKLILIMSNKDKESVIANNMLMSLADLDKKYKLNIFQLSSRISIINNRWDGAFFISLLEEYITSIEKVYICGNSNFMLDIKALLLETNLVINDEIILL